MSDQKSRLGQSGFPVAKILVPPLGNWYAVATVHLSIHARFSERSLLTVMDTLP